MSQKRYSVEEEKMIVPAEVPPKDWQGTWTDSPEYGGAKVTTRGNGIDVAIGED